MKEGRRHEEEIKERDVHFFLSMYAKRTVATNMSCRAVQFNGKGSAFYMRVRGMGGELSVEPGDYIVQFAKRGSLYVLKAADFEREWQPEPTFRLRESPLPTDQFSRQAESIRSKPKPCTERGASIALEERLMDIETKLAMFRERLVKTETKLERINEQTK